MQSFVPELNQDLKLDSIEASIIKNANDLTLFTNSTFCGGQDTPYTCKQARFKRKDYSTSILNSFERYYLNNLTYRCTQPERGIFYTQNTQNATHLDSLPHSSTAYIKENYIIVATHVYGLDDTKNNIGNRVIIEKIKHKFNNLLFTVPQWIRVRAAGKETVDYFTALVRARFPLIENWRDIFKTDVKIWSACVVSFALGGVDERSKMKFHNLDARLFRIESWKDALSETYIKRREDKYSFIVEIPLKIDKLYAEHRTIVQDIRQTFAEEFSSAVGIEKTKAKNKDDLDMLGWVERQSRSYTDRHWKIKLPGQVQVVSKFIESEEFLMWKISAKVLQTDDDDYGEAVHDALYACMRCSKNML
jgi:hypothetical protein